MREDIIQPYKKKCGLWAITVDNEAKKFTVLVRLVTIGRWHDTNGMQGTKESVEKSKMLSQIHFGYVCLLRLCH